MTEATSEKAPAPRPRRIAVFGGSFNPPHIGHVAVVSYVLSAGDVDAVWLTPCPSHAFNKALEPFDHRMAMCSRALAIFAPGRAVVSDIEARLPLPARTIDTLAALRTEHPGARFDLVVGTDILAERASWKRWDELEASTRLVVIGRDGYPAPDGYAASPALVTVSSTEIRQSIARGGHGAGLLPSEVREYIAANRLYR